MDDDYQLALLLQKEFNDEGPAIINENKWKGKENYPGKHKASSLVDPQWEFIDPTPDIHVLFMQFNDRFFWSKLHGVEVRWSPRMTSCAGVCVYQGRSGFCSVRLSLPLLKLRPRKDLVETLLHEMIHAFLFVTKNNRDRDGHGPEFHKHMNRINQEAGTHISVYHSFHDEVRLYQQHWWRCDGPCQKRPPFFGMVRRSMNRAPGPSDNWWAQHQATCGGNFIKVREPENTKKKTSDAKKKSSDESSSGVGDIRSFFPGGGSKTVQGGVLGKPKSFPGSTAPKSTPGSALGKPSGIPSTGVGTLNRLDSPSGSSDSFSNSNNGSQQPGLFKRPTMSNVHGFGGGQSVVKPVANPAVNNVFGFGDLSGRGRGKPTGMNQPSGKGHVLGGSGKPPPPRGRGAFGGMLANRGGGTFVVTGKADKTKDLQDSSIGSPSSTVSQPAPVQAFQGTGHVLGRGAPNTDPPSRPRIQGPQAGRANPFQKNIPVFTNKPGGSQVMSEPSKRSSPNSFNEIQPKKKSLDSFSSKVGEAGSSVQARKVPCPVCNQQVLESVINSHLDECINGSTPATNSEVVQTINDTDDVIILSDSGDEDDDNEHGHLVDCPSCTEKLPEKQLESHLSRCLGSTFEDDDDDIAVVPNDGRADAKCPICGEIFPAADMDRHLDNCASCSVQDLSGVFDEDFSEDEEEDAAVGTPKQVSQSGERLYPCPCCLILTESSKMNEHLDRCMV